MAVMNSASNYTTCMNLVRSGRLPTLADLQVAHFLGLPDWDHRVLCPGALIDVTRLARRAHAANVIGPLLPIDIGPYSLHHWVFGGWVLGEIEWECMCKYGYGLQ